MYLKRGKKDMTSVLEDKHVLIVDDEPDVLETLTDFLGMCLIDSAPGFDAAQKLLEKNTYDAAVLDIMGVRGFELLGITTRKKIPTLMLTAHALSPEMLVQSLKQGAHAYIPKDRISEIASFVQEIIEAHEKIGPDKDNWFIRLKSYFDRRFGSGWREADKEFWREFDQKYLVSRKELEDIL